MKRLLIFAVLIAACNPLLPKEAEEENLNPSDSLVNDTSNNIPARGSWEIWNWEGNKVGMKRGFFKCHHLFRIHYDSIAGQYDSIKVTSFDSVHSYISGIDTLYVRQYSGAAKCEYVGGDSSEWRYSMSVSRSRTYHFSGDTPYYIDDAVRLGSGSFIYKRRVGKGDTITVYITDSKYDYVATYRKYHRNDSFVFPEFWTKDS